MPSVNFYLLPDEQKDAKAHLLAACDVAALHFRQKQKVWVFCPDQAAAEAFDELLWQRPVDGFVPHNLTGEIVKGGAPVEIGWEVPQRQHRQVLINLHPDFPGFCHQFQHIADFVPAEEKLKEQARLRYKHYRAAGCELTTQPAESLNERNNG